MQPFYSIFFSFLLFVYETSPQLLRLFRRCGNSVVAVKVRKCFVDKKLHPTFHRQGIMTEFSFLGGLFG